ncbi:hypothetical protein PG997_010742 [Apiospora hydei]|uniref:Uncharacterized protein n=1 Tax=Apiospora hydei TaxID=1337664 RepID=A0ABR1VH47_9PEZI
MSGTFTAREQQLAIIAWGYFETEPKGSWSSSRTMTWGSRCSSAKHQPWFKIPGTASLLTSIYMYSEIYCAKEGKPVPAYVTLCGHWEPQMFAGPNCEHFLHELSKTHHLLAWKSSEDPEAEKAVPFGWPYSWGSFFARRDFNERWPLTFLGQKKGFLQAVLRESWQRPYHQHAICPSCAHDDAGLVPLWQSELRGCAVHDIWCGRKEFYLLTPATFLLPCLGLSSA